MEKLLTLKERNTLIARHRKERNGRVRDRIKAILAYDEGYSYTEIAKILLLDDETIRRHIADYLNEKKLIPANGGSTSHFSKTEAKALISHLLEVTYLYVKDICQYVKSTFGKCYNISGMTAWLHKNGFHYKKPHGRLAKANSDQQRIFIAKYNRLKSKSAGKEPIYFCDSVHPQHQTQLSYG